VVGIICIEHAGVTEALCYSQYMYHNNGAEMALQ